MAKALRPLLLASLSLAACSPWKGVRMKDTSSASVMLLDNTSRAVLAWPRVNGAPRMCLEFSTPVTLLRATTAYLRVSVPGYDVAAGHGGSQSADHAYSVGDIMQFMHESLFRLCESLGNGAIKEDEFYAELKKTIESTTALLTAKQIAEAREFYEVLAKRSSEIRITERERRLSVAGKTMPAVEEKAQIREAMNNLLKLIPANK